MITAIDTSVLVAISQQEVRSQEWRNRLNQSGSEGTLIICPVVFAEYSARFSKIDTVREVLNDMSIRWSSFNDQSSYLAGRTYLRYRRNKGPRKTMIPDFLIAAHAQLQADQLAAIDRGYLRTYFPKLKILTP